MAIATYTLIIILNVNGLKAQPKVIDWLNGYKNKTCICAAYKRLTSDLETHTKLKWGDGKKYSMQMEIKERWSSNIYIRQNRL